MDIVAISGSLDRNSSNTALVEALAAASDDLPIRVWDELGTLPHFRPDTDGDEHVGSLRDAIARADVVLVATPEYAGGMPGTLKNALDWLVGTGELYGKSLIVVSAAPSDERGGNARRWVADVARMQGATVLDSFTVDVRRTDPASLTAGVATALDRLRRALR